MKSIETCRDCGRKAGAHTLECPTFGRQANAVLHRQPSPKATRKEGNRAR